MKNFISSPRKLLHLHLLEQKDQTQYHWTLIQVKNQSLQSLRSESISSFTQLQSALTPYASVPILLSLTGHFIRERKAESLVQLFGAQPQNSNDFAFQYTPHQTIAAIRQEHLTQIRSSLSDLPNPIISINLSTHYQDPNKHISEFLKTSQSLYNDPLIIERYTTYRRQSLIITIAKASTIILSLFALLQLIQIVDLRQSHQDCTTLLERHEEISVQITQEETLIQQQEAILQHTPWHVPPTPAAWIIDRLFTKCPEEFHLHAFRFSADSASIEISGQTPTPGSINLFLDSLKSLPFIQHHTLSKAQYESFTNSYTFDVSISLKL